MDVEETDVDEMDVERVVRVVAVVRDVEEVAATDELELEPDDEVVRVRLLELDTTTGFRLLYIDNRLAPPHYES